MTDSDREFHYRLMTPDQREQLGQARDYPGAFHTDYVSLDHLVNEELLFDDIEEDFSQ